MKWVQNGGDSKGVQEINEDDKQYRVSDDNAVSDEDGCGNNEHDVQQTQPNKHCKTLTRSRIVNNIDVSPNEDNFDPIHYLNGYGKGETLTDLPGPKKKKKTPTIEWQSEFPNLPGRQLQTDVIRTPLLSLRSPARNVTIY